MENFDDFENKSYVKATRVNYKWKDYITFGVNFLTFVAQVVAVVVQEAFVNFIKIFRPDKPKSISGQLALVTGLFF